jgi:hypothetical protein
MSAQTLLRPLGGETYIQFLDHFQKTVVLTYNDLWTLIVCRTSLDGDWHRTRQAALLVYDATNKRAIADRLWTLEQHLGGLPEIPSDVQNLHIHRAYLWFKQRPVIQDKQW